MVRWRWATTAGKVYNKFISWGPVLIWQASPFTSRTVFPFYSLLSLPSHLYPMLWPNQQICDLQITHALWGNILAALSSPGWPCSPPTSMLSCPVQLYYQKALPQFRPESPFFPNLSPGCHTSLELRTPNSCVSIYSYVPPLRLEIVISSCQDPAELRTQRGTQPILRWMNKSVTIN